MTDRRPLEFCPLCDSKIDPQALETYRKDYIVECRACGFVYSLLISNDADYGRIYGAYDYAGENAARTATSIEKAGATTGGVRQVFAQGPEYKSYRILQAVKQRGFAANVSEQRFSDDAQSRVAGNPMLGLVKKAVNRGLIASGLGSSIEAIYVKQ